MLNESGTRETEPSYESISMQSFSEEIEDALKQSLHGKLMSAEYFSADGTFMVSNRVTGKQHLVVEAGAMNSANIRENNGLPKNIEVKKQDNSTFIKANDTIYELTGHPLYNFEGELTRFTLVCNRYTQEK